MNVSQASGSSAAWMLQRLFQSSGDSDTTRTAESAGRQKLPGDNDPKSNAGGAAAPMMSGKTMGAMVSMQMEPPSASDVASDLVSSLDTNGDGEVSTEEITAAFSAADHAPVQLCHRICPLEADRGKVFAVLARVVDRADVQRRIAILFHRAPAFEPRLQQYLPHRCEIEDRKSVV